MKYLMEADRNDLIYGMTNYEGLPGMGLHAGEWRHHELGRVDRSVAHSRHVDLDRRVVHGGNRRNPKRRQIARLRALCDQARCGWRPDLREGKYRSIHGDIVSDWRIENGMFKLSVTVPPGTTATVFVPGAGPVSTQAPPTAENRRFEVMAGTHVFETKL